MKKLSVFCLGFLFVVGSACVGFSADGDPLLEGKAPFSGLTSGTNTRANMIVGTGSSLSYAGGSISASHYKGNSVPSAVEFGYLDGATSNLQHQINAIAVQSSGTSDLVWTSGAGGVGSWEAPTSGWVLVNHADPEAVSPWYWLSPPTPDPTHKMLVLGPISGDAGTAQLNTTSINGVQAIFALSNSNDLVGGHSSGTYVDSMATAGIYTIGENDFVGSDPRVNSYGAYLEGRATTRSAVGAELNCQNTSGYAPAYINPYSMFPDGGAPVSPSVPIRSIAAVIACGGTKPPDSTADASAGITINKVGNSQFYTGIVFGDGSVYPKWGYSEAISFPNGYNISWYSDETTVSRLYSLNGNLSWAGSSGLSSLLTTTGSIYAAGNISASGSKAFEIIHPLDENKLLRHVAVESPLVDLMYRGKAALVDGSVDVNMDDEFGMITGTFGKLTQKGASVFVTNNDGWTQVKGSLSGAVLSISSKESCNDEVSWLVVAERGDDALLASNSINAEGHLVVEEIITEARRTASPQIDSLKKLMSRGKLSPKSKNYKKAK